MKITILFKSIYIKVKKFFNRFYRLKLSYPHFQPSFQHVNVKTVENHIKPFKTAIYQDDILNHFYTYNARDNLNNDIVNQQYSRAYRCYPYPLNIEN